MSLHSRNSWMAGRSRACLRSQNYGEPASSLAVANWIKAEYWGHAAQCSQGRTHQRGGRGCQAGFRLAVHQEAASSTRWNCQPAIAQSNLLSGFEPSTPALHWTSLSKVSRFDRQMSSEGQIFGIGRQRSLICLAKHHPVTPLPSRS